MLWLIPIMLYASQPVLYNASIQNTTDIATLFQHLNNSPAYGGYLGMGVSLAFFVIFLLILSYRIRIVQAALAASFFSILLSLLLVTLGIEPPTVTMLFVAVSIVMAFLIVTDRILHPLD